MYKNNKSFPATQHESYDVIHDSGAIGINNENYSREMEFRLQEMEMQKNEAELSFQFSKMSLEMQVAARKDQWTHQAVLQRNLYILISLIFTGVSGLIAASLLLDKESVAIELIKMVVYISAGGFGGYGLSKSKKKDQGERGGD